MTLRATIPRLVIREGEPVPTLAGETGPDVERWPDPDGNLFAYVGTRDGRHWMELPGLASYCFADGAEAVYAFTRSTLLSGRVREMYDRAVLPVVLQALGTEVLHASAVQTGGGVVAFCAESRTGKSTVAYGLVHRGYRPWADDAVAFEVGEAGAWTLPLPFRMRLRPAAAAFFGQQVFPSLATLTGDADDVGAPRPAPLAALCLLRRVPPSDAERAVRAERVPSAQAFPALLAHAYCFTLGDHDRKRRMLQNYLRLAARAPVLAVSVAEGLERLPAALAEIMPAVSRAVNLVELARRDGGADPE